MERIGIEELDLAGMKKYINQGNNSTIYEDDTKMIKVLNQYYDEEKEELFYKSQAMDFFHIDAVVWPREIYVKNNQVEAYMMEKFSHSKTLTEKYENYGLLDQQRLFGSLKESSLILREIHKEKIIGNDISFDNILINNKGQLKYIDLFDSCHYGPYCSSSFIPSRLQFFMNLYRKETDFPYNQNMDRLCLLLAAYGLINGKKDIANFILSKTNTVGNINQCVSKLKNTDPAKAFPTVPYIDELVDSNELKLTKTLLKKY